MSRKSPVASRAAGYFQRTDEDVPQMSGHSLSRMARQPVIETSKRTKRTYYLPADIAILLEELQLEEYRRTGSKPELSALVAEGIRLLGQSRRSDS
ncbi:MAG TPA: hypothetical protein VK988_14055 [Acidimicrobiales bacterium]|nr:hypothetical protein [Acidimicrobiales bacterium]